MDLSVDGVTPIMDRVPGHEQRSQQSGRSNPEILDLMDWIGINKRIGSIEPGIRGLD